MLSQEPPRRTREHPAIVRMYARAVRRCARVAVLVAILHPLPDVAVHVMQAEGVGRERADLDRLLPVLRPWRCRHRCSCR